MKKNVSTTISTAAAAHCVSSTAPVITSLATAPPWTDFRPSSIALSRSARPMPSGSSTPTTSPAPFCTLANSSSDCDSTPGMISAHRPKNTTTASSTLAAAAGAGRHRCARSQVASGVSSVASSSEMITGRTTSIIRPAPSATSTTPPTTIIARRVTADATARPRGTASSPFSSTGARGSGRPLEGRGRVSIGAEAIVPRGLPSGARNKRAGAGKG